MLQYCGGLQVSRRKINPMTWSGQNVHASRSWRSRNRFRIWAVNWRAWRPLAVAAILFAFSSSYWARKGSDIYALKVAGHHIYLATSFRSKPYFLHECFVTLLVIVFCVISWKTMVTYPCYCLRSRSSDSVRNSRLDSEAFLPVWRVHCQEDRYSCQF